MKICRSLNKKIEIEKQIHVDSSCGLSLWLSTRSIYSLFAIRRLIRPSSKTCFCTYQIYAVYYDSSKKVAVLVVLLQTMRCSACDIHITKSHFTHIRFDIVNPNRVIFKRSFRPHSTSKTFEPSCIARRQSYSDMIHSYEMWLYLVGTYSIHIHSYVTVLVFTYSSGAELSIARTLCSSFSNWLWTQTDRTWLSVVSRCAINKLEYIYIILTLLFVLKHFAKYIPVLPVALSRRRSIVALYLNLFPFVDHIPGAENCVY